MQKGVQGGTFEQHSKAGKIGGKAKNAMKGFGSSNKRATKFGSIGGRLGKRGKKLLDVDYEKGVATYMDKESGMVEDIQLSEALLKDLEDAVKELYGEPTIY